MITIQTGLGAGENAGELNVKSDTAGAVRIITFNRLKARNAINLAMTETLTTAVVQTARDANIYAIIIQSEAPGVFCVGGDVREMARLAAIDHAAADQALAAEYRLVWLLECFSKPVISLINGAVMGAGAGMTLVNTHKVAGKRYAFSMPEVRLGFFPDDGVAAVLGRMPDHVGIYLGLTGRSIGRDDAFALGLVTHCIDEQHFAHIRQCLANADPVDALLDGLHEPPCSSALEEVRSCIRDCFSAPSVAEIIARLRELRESAAHPERKAWATGVMADIARACPIALSIALRHIRDAASMDLRQTLIVDYRIGRRLTGSHNFQAGVQAVIVDKGRQPEWQPRDIADVTDARIETLFHADPAHELILRTREEMQAARV